MQATTTRRRLPGRVPIRAGDALCQHNVLADVPKSALLSLLVSSSLMFYGFTRTPSANGGISEKETEPWRRVQVRTWYLHDNNYTE